MSETRSHPASALLARRFALGALLTALLVLLAAPLAGATTTTVGSPLTVSGPSFVCAVARCTAANTALGEPGAAVASPASGTIVAWRVVGATGTLALRVLRPAGGGAYTGAGTDSSVTPASTALQTFTTSLPIQAGDLIGLDVIGASSQIGRPPAAGSTASVWIPLADGTTATPFGTTYGVEYLFNADVLSGAPVPPGINAVTPASGPVTGGTSVVILGHDFNGATAVTFGTLPAASLTVNSNSQITAVSPPASAGAVDVTVTTPLGSSAVVAKDVFTFTTLALPPPGPGPAPPVLSAPAPPDSGGGGRGGGGTPPAGARDLSLGAPSVGPDGTIMVPVNTPSAGSIAATAKTSAGLKVLGIARKRKKPKAGSVDYGSGSTTASGPSTVRVYIKPSAAAMKLLRKGRSVLVSIAVTFTPAAGARVTKTVAALASIKKTKTKKRKKKGHSGVGITP